MSWRAVRWAMEAAQQVRLSSVQRLVLLTLAYHHNDKTSCCIPSNETLRAETGLSRRAVQLAVQALEASGLVTVSPRAVHGIQTSNQYDLFGKPKGRTTCTRGGASDAPRGGARNGTAGAHHVHPNSSYPEGSTSNVTAFPVQRERML
ncbi:hypothetical protein GVY41_09115 [Frigidibacter albus]|uniref:Helix-turn-helix domain-containing protein n=1 Tax=Frigidibacter albus TaxID=1465486 RepID=A0A6L8VI88_9RHOB|nr:helix-turn-helix domain-containing protein [Frigidibacter albus]MZQ89252.1 hypothetical protein [Frigidibacter albus]NBE31158.1 hypothetical protein [Frigidibacter albus]GGH53188.1 hypothetical protein GCM10011341_18420 [Frigidibacter albus]